MGHEWSEEELFSSPFQFLNHIQSESNDFVSHRFQVWARSCRQWRTWAFCSSRAGFQRHFGAALWALWLLTSMRDGHILSQITITTIRHAGPTPLSVQTFGGTASTPIQSI